MKTMKVQPARRNLISTLIAIRQSNGVKNMKIVENVTDDYLGLSHIVKVIGFRDTPTYRKSISNSSE